MCQPGCPGGACTAAPAITRRACRRVAPMSRTRLSFARRSAVAIRAVLSSASAANAMTSPLSQAGDWLRCVALP